MIEIVVNGEKRQVPTGTTVKTLLTLFEVPPERVAVELDRSIIKKSFWESTEVLEGAKVEIVHFVGGG
jgi:sulfur carrier protein